MHTIKKEDGQAYQSIDIKRMDLDIVLNLCTDWNKGREKRRKITKE